MNLSMARLEDTPSSSLPSPHTLHALTLITKCSLSTSSIAANATSAVLSSLLAMAMAASAAQMVGSCSHKCGWQLSGQVWMIIGMLHARSLDEQI